MPIDWKKYRNPNMEGLADFHCHTTFCDGNDSPEDMVREAVKRGMKALGFSGHCHTPYDESYCMLERETAEYKAEIKRLRNMYSDKIDVLCGIEQDCLAGKADADWDYVIGSVHYVRCGRETVPVDETPEIIREATGRYFGGDIFSFVEKYFETAARVVEKTGADIIGHFDIICKHNTKTGRLFDEGHPRYVAAWKKAADTLLKYGVPFEINSAPIYRGFRREPYPARGIREYIMENGGKFVFSSDSHSRETLGYTYRK